MNEKEIYGRLNWSSSILIALITLTVLIFLLDIFSLTVFKIIISALLVFALVLIVTLKKTISHTIFQGKIRLKSAEYKFEKIYESTIIGILISNFDGVVIDANDTFLNMIGYSREELIKGEIRWSEITAPEFIPQSLSAIEDLKSSGQCAPFEKQYIRKDGTRVWVLIGSSALQDHNRAQAVTYIIDITNRKEAFQKTDLLQKIIDKQQEEFKSVFMNAPAFITVRRGPELRYDFVNRAVTEFSKRNDHYGKTPEEMYPGLIDPKDAKIGREVFETGKPQKGSRHKLNFTEPNGHQKEIYLDFNITPVYDQQGDIDGIAAFGFEVTDLVLANKEMEISKNRMEFIADSMPHKVWVADEKGNVNYLNKAWMSYANISLDDVNSWKWDSLIHPDERDEYNRKLLHSFTNQTEFSMETRLMDAGGEYRWHVSNAICLKDNSDEVVMWVGTNTDINDQKMEVDQLKHAEKYFKILADETPFMVWKADVDGKCVYVNKKWIEFTGISFNDSLGFGFYSAIIMDDSEERKFKWLESVKRRIIYHNKLQLIDAEGKIHWVFAQANPLYINSRFEGYVGSMVDITEQELASQAIKDLSEKKDEFLSIASHELKTPLTSIKASIQLIEKMVDDDHSAHKFALKASDHLLRLERLISDLLDVSKINAGKLVYNETEFDFMEMLADSVRSMQLTSHSHQLIIAQTEPVLFKGDRFRIEQVIFNFLSNAIKYSPDADKVIIKLEIIDDNIVVSVQDFGIGIEPENLSKTFDRYYRVDNTSMRFQGLGLGLFISNEILKRHQGSLWIESEPGVGSVFYFSLPLCIQKTECKPDTDNQTFYSDSKLDIKYIPDKQWLYAEWKGFQNFETVKKGCLVMLDLLKKNNCSKVLNDNSKVIGSWSEAADWGGEIWFPQMEEAGLRNFAWIYSGSTFSRLSANKLVKHKESEIKAEFFINKACAESWLANNSGETIN
ncbi:PAS domain S-box protein [Daejeonella oryzae]|uniref:PAS domain S-box protein n=1 Tax=Daejeonella oryzae TaxID=1122943 RepID=UPI00041789DA|nr:PAS domain S-box protein [Daejeonella oryzae]